MANDFFLRALEEMCDAPEGSFEPATRLSDMMGWDSLTVVKFIAFLDTEYGITVESEKVYTCQTAADLEALVDAQRSAQQS